MISEKTRKEFNGHFHLFLATAAQAGMRFNKNQFSSAVSSLKSALKTGRAILSGLKPLSKKYGNGINPMLNGTRKKARKARKRKSAFPGIARPNKNFKYQIRPE